MSHFINHIKEAPKDKLEKIKQNLNYLKIPTEHQKRVMKEIEKELASR